MSQNENNMRNFLRGQIQFAGRVCPRRAYPSCRLGRRKPHRRSYRLGTGRVLAVIPTPNRIIFSVISLHVLVRNLGGFLGPEYMLAIDASYLGASFVAYSGWFCQDTSTSAFPEDALFLVLLKSVLCMDAFRGGGIPLAVQRSSKH